MHGVIRGLKLLKKKKKTPPQNQLLEKQPPLAYALIDMALITAIYINYHLHSPSAKLYYYNNIILVLYTDTSYTQFRCSRPTVFVAMPSVYYIVYRYKKKYDKNATLFPLNRKNRLTVSRQTAGPSNDIRLDLNVLSMHSDFTVQQ